MSQTAHRGLQGVDVDHRIREYEATDPIDREDFPDRARQVIENEINAGAEDDDEERSGGKRLKIEWLESGRVKLHATSFVGLVTLPGELTIEILPKVKGTDLLSMLQFSHGIEAETTDEETRLEHGEEFIQALATLFESELDQVLTRGLHASYRRTQGTEKHVRGRIDVHRQLQRHGPQPTRFECTYDELTRDTVLNQAVLYATDILLRLVGRGRVGQALERHKQELQRRVELRPVRLVELDGIELSRLSEHYEDLYRLTRLVLSGIYIDELQAGGRATSSLLVNMNDIFESVVVEGVRRTYAGATVEVLSQARRRELFHKGARSVLIRPDVAVMDGEETVLVGDAKWKVDRKGSRSPSSGDLNQMIGYQVAYDGPGVLFYPEQDGRVQSVYKSKLEKDIQVIEIPVQSTQENGYAKRVMEHICTEIGPASEEEMSVEDG